LKEEAKSREDLVESLAVARKRVLEASEVHFYFPKNLGGQTNHTPRQTFANFGTDAEQQD
jgi:hypothetical protein